MTTNKHNDTSRLADIAASRLFSSLKREYVLVGRRQVKSRHAWLIIGLMAGATFTLALVANRSGRFEASRASELNAIAPPSEEMRDLDVLKKESRSLRELLGRPNGGQQVGSSSTIPTVSSQSSQQRSSPGEVEAALLDHAKKRLDIMERIVEKNPQAVLAESLSPDERNQYPAAVKNEIEEYMTLEGKIDIVHADDFINKKSTTDYTLVSGGKGYKLYLTKEISGRLLSNSTVRVRGLRVRQKIAVPTGI